MATSPQQKRALKRLMQDLEELQGSPVHCVSAAPLDNDMFEWHCNFQLDDSVVHVILFFPDTYPFVSPSAEFVPQGFRYLGGASMAGKKGVKVCMSIFSDFENLHPEWATEKGIGWSPGYTVQTVLLNLLSFMAEQMNGAESIKKINNDLARNFTCNDCGHEHEKPFPPFECEPAALNDARKMETQDERVPALNGASTMETENERVPTLNDASKMETQDERMPEIIDYLSKIKFKSITPTSEEELFGFGLIQAGPADRPAFSTPCEYLTEASYYGMKKEFGKVHSIMKEELAFFLPMYISKAHGDGIKDTFEKTMKELSEIMPNCKSDGVEDLVIKAVQNLKFSKETQHTSDNHLSGYFALHRLFLWAIETYPDLQKKIDDKMDVFMNSENMRSRNECPNIGGLLMLLAGSSKYRWPDVADAYLSECCKRNVMWYVKNDAKLGYLDTDKQYRLDATFNATAADYKLLAFQVLFLNIAMPAGMSHKDITQRYDDNYGLPTPNMLIEMKQACDQITNIKTYADWFMVMKLPVPSDDELYQHLVSTVEFSINTEGYHCKLWRNQGGWRSVLKKYRNGTPGFPKNETDDETAEVTPKGKGKGKGKSSLKEEKPRRVLPKRSCNRPVEERMKPRAEAQEEKPRRVLPKRRCTKRAVEEMEIEDEQKPRAKRLKADVDVAMEVGEEEVAMEVDEAPRRGKGRGRVTLGRDRRAAMRRQHKRGGT